MVHDQTNNENTTKKVINRTSQSHCSIYNESDSIDLSEKSPRQHEQLHHSNDEASPLACFFDALTRKKPLDCRTDTNLNRCLNLLDLTALGVGSTLGLGLYVLTGQVASNKAGPAVVISFAMAALASAFSALCYAEFAGRVPKAGSAYSYSYISVGEFVAFIIGWNLVLEYVIGASSVARGFSGYNCFVYKNLIQSLGYHQSNTLNIATQTDNNTGAFFLNKNKHNISMTLNNSNHLMAHMANSTMLTTDLSFITSILNYVAEYFDWPSVVIITVITVVIIFGVKESTNLTLVFTSVNLFVVVVVVVSSLGSLDLHNWRLSKSEVPNGYGEGGFIPYGWSGVLAGSATCFFGFIGFDTIASSAEEAKNPKRNVPLSILLSLFISFIAYMAIASVQTLIWPYYDQNKITILPYIFERLNMPVTYWVVLLGAIAGLASSQLGGMYPLPRILYSMAQDRLIYGYLSKVNRKLKLPVRATVVGSIFVALLACLLDIQDLADMVSIGTLAAYSLVALSVLILRYENRSDAVDDSTILSSHLSFADIVEHSTVERSTSDSTCDFTTATKVIDIGTKDNQENSLTPSTTLSRTKLQAKPSTPIREKGSKALVPQFNSWFKSANLQDQNGEAVGTNVNNIAKRQSFLDLLIIWKADNEMRDRPPDQESSRRSKILISIIVILSIIIDIVALCFTHIDGSANQTRDHLIVGAINRQHLFDPKVLLGCTGCILLVVLAAVMLMLARQPTSRSMKNDMFQVPLVPLIPTLSILVNTFLMLNLSYLTWIRFTVWMAFGFIIYFTYGIWNSEGYLLYLDG